MPGPRFTAAGKKLTRMLGRSSPASPSLRAASRGRSAVVVVIGTAAPGYPCSRRARIPRSRPMFTRGSRLCRK